MKIQIPMAYQLRYEEKLDDLNGTGILLTHKRSGARITLIPCEDDNKVFSVGFRTPPANSTGVAHIIEHTVLCGSKNFPAKDPFIELAKGSLNTFLNAMTYSDKTIYPVASRNDQDFKNLMHVYMDAVFYPNIYNRKEIFYQEGWHYDLENEEAELKYNGVVYNEMKGAFSSPEQQLFRLMQNSVFPDTAYGVESGGDPDFIPELSYEEFLDFHRTYYHPSNSYIFLYGDMDFEERLNWLDEEYLSKYDTLNVNSTINSQKGFDSMKEITAYYSIGEDEDSKENTYLSLSMVMGNTLDVELGLAIQILTYVLLDAPGSPIKQALIDAGIGKDILNNYSDELLQPILSIIAKNTEENRKEEFLQIIRNVLMNLSEKGIDKKSLLAAINYYEFRYREADYGQFPKGLMYGIRVMSSWLYDDDKPFLHLHDNDGFEFLKSKIGTGYYEQLIKEYFLNNTHSSFVILKPKPGLNSEKESMLRKKLDEYKQKLSKEEIAGLIKDTIHLREYQEEPSSREDLEKIPMITREDISKDTKPFYNEEHVVNNIKVVHHNINTNKIAYVRFLFDICDIPQELTPYLSLLSLVLGYVNTEKYSYLELSNEININTGGISTDVKSFSKTGGRGEYVPVFECATKVLYDKLPDSFALIEEILFHSKIEDKKRLLEIIDEMKSRMQMRFKSSGDSVAVDRAMSYYSLHGLFKENTVGIAFYQFLENITENFNEKADEVFDKLKALISLIFVKEKMFVSITSDEEGLKLFGEEFKSFASVFKEKAEKEVLKAYTQENTMPQKRNEGFKAAMQVQYVVRVGNYMNSGFDYTGALKVLKIILSYDYLWNNVRVKGGAYGCRCGFSAIDGDAFFSSYRDPNLKETNQIYENVVDYIRNFDADERDITKYIIGTISMVDAPLTPQNNGRRSLSAYLTGLDIEDLEKEREEILNVTVDKIRALANLVEAVLKDGYICVIGNENKINENRELFGEVKNLMK